MSILDRLMIQGVRSFGIKKEDAAEIKFKCPLTLILGHNGCGKTTIIESLKYATSGDQPPNAKAGPTGTGSGFVHDPKMLKANEVLAQVKLRIRDINGKKSTVVRSMKNIQKLKKVEFKSVDQTITTENEITGKGDAISNRCADTDIQMCYLLGVSKPILNYVIFCHQEESCWPMEEGKKVKDRFDEIFDSVKYNKCLESIRKLKKQRTQEILMLKRDAESLLVYRNEADEKTKKCQEEENRLTATDEIVRACVESITVIDGKLDAVKDKEINIANLIAEKKVNEIKLEELRKAVKEIRTGLRDKEFKGTDEELETEISSFNKDLREKKSELDELEKSLSGWVVAEKSLRSKLSEKQNELGGLKRDSKANDELIENRNEAINKLAADLNLQEMASPYSKSQVESVTDNVEVKLRELKSDLEFLKRRNDEEEKRLQSIIDEFREEKAKLEQIKKAKNDQLVETESEIEKVKTEINEVTQSTKNLSILENRLKRISKELEEHSNSLNVNDVDKEIKELQKTRDRMADEFEEINKEMDKLIEVDRIQTTLDSCLDRKVSCEDEIERLRKKNGEAFLHLLESVPQRNISQSLETCIRRLSENIRSLQRDINDKRQEVTKLESKQNHLEEKLRTANQTLSRDKEQIEKICGNNNYEVLLADVVNKLKSKQSETGKLSASDYLYREYIKKLQQPQPCCPLCKRDFEEEDSAIQLAHELEDKLKSIPSTLSSLTEDQEKLNDKLSKLQQLKPIYERVASLDHSEIPAYRKELDEIKGKLVELNEELGNMENILFGPQSDEQLARTVQSDAITIDQKVSELDVLLREIEEHQSRIPASGKTLQQVRNEREQLQFELDNTRKKIDSSQSKKVSYNERLNKLQNDKNDIIKEQLKVQTGKQREQQLLDKEKELKELKITLLREIDSATNKVFPVQQKLDQANSNKEEARKKHSESIDCEAKKLNLLERKLDEVLKMKNKIADFERRGIATKLDETERKICEFKRDLDGIEQKKSLDEAKKDTIKADLSNQDGRQRDLLDNKKLRTKRIEEKSLHEKMKDMDEKLGVLDYNVIKDERRRLEYEMNSLTSKKSHAEGRRNELAISLANLRSEMNKPIYKNALKNYKDKIIDLHVEEAVNKDLDSYYIALDWALKHFHKERMAEINFIIKELWHRIYRGNDIDHIEIKCDVEASTSADKKRAYNYRVVQVKNDIELDMRGRCSAGQKMLASIIIRMALAETFSNNCRIMTLDEPTTNLDRDNIESLSRALAEIVNDQTKHKKFQLVIITHDEDFLMRLTNIDKVDQFWRVFKNEEGLSRIELCPV